LFNLVYTIEGDEQGQPAHKGQALPYAPSSSAPKSA
jgi:hypothetical protein